MEQIACKECGKILHPLYRRPFTGLCLPCYNKIPRPKADSLTDGRGYVWLHIPDHHRANHVGYVKRAVVVLENKIGRQLTDKELPHHINKNKGDDNPENLEVLTFREHGKLHSQLSPIPHTRKAYGVKIGDDNYRFINGDGLTQIICPDCGQKRWIDIGAIRHKGFNGRCKPCSSKNNIQIARLSR